MWRGGRLLRICEFGFFMFWMGCTDVRFVIRVYVLRECDGAVPREFHAL